MSKPELVRDILPRALADIFARLREVPTRRPASPPRAKPAPPKPVVVEGA